MALAYPLFHSKGIYENQREADPNKRVVNLTRSAYAGQQRYSTAVWSGDINGDWTTFARQIPAGMNVSLSGLPYWTTDSGGFFRPAKQYTSIDYNELQARWFQWSTFLPIQRIHGYQTKTEFWNWLPETQSVLIAYDKLRYRLLPYNYSTAWQVTAHNSTMIRPLIMDFPTDAKAVETSDEYMFGPAFLVHPVTQPAIQSVQVYLPRGADWYNFWTGDVQPGGQFVTAHTDLQRMPLFVKAGSILPLGPDVQYASEKPDGDIELRIYPGADGDFTLYEDEGDGYHYEQGVYATVPIHWDNVLRTLTFGRRVGAYPGMPKSRQFHLVLVGSGSGTGGENTSASSKSTTYRGVPQTLSLKR